MNLPLREFADVVAVMKGPGASATGSEGRRTSRMTVFAKIQVHLFDNDKVGRSFTVLTRDISISGVGLLQAVVLPQGRQAILTLPRSSGPLFVCARVMHCRTLADGLMTVGMEFTKILDDASAKKLLSDDADELARVQRSVLS